MYQEQMRIRSDDGADWRRRVELVYFARVDGHWMYVSGDCLLLIEVLPYPSHIVTRHIA